MTTHLTDTQKTQIRIALATWEGWTEIEDLGGDYEYGLNPRGWREKVTNYPADLNACHAIEVKLTDGEHAAFRHHLIAILVELGFLWLSQDKEFVSASAEPRSLALFFALNLGELGD